MPQSFDIVVVGGANYDYLARGKHLPAPGQTVAGDAIHDAPGGKGANQAVAAARLGARVAFIGRVGADQRGDSILNGFAASGIDTSGVVRDPKAPSGVALIQVNEHGEKQILAVHGANLHVTAEQVRSNAEIIRRAKVLLLQLEIPMEATLAAARLAQQHGVRIVLDPAPAVPLDDELIRMADWLKPNSSEAETITGIAVTDRASARQAIEQLLHRGAKVVSIAVGAGTLIVDGAAPDREWWLPRLPVRSVDATGAGDAFAAGIGYALFTGQALDDAARFANATAALATTVVGAQESFPTREKVEALLATTN